MKMQQKLKEIDVLSEKWSKKINNTISSAQHLYILGISISLSTIIYIILIKSINLKFITPQSTAINWLTIHKYPKQQDYYLFISYMLFTYLSTLFIWFIWVSLKSKK